MARSVALVAALVAMVMAVEYASIVDAKHKSYLRVYETSGCRNRSEKYESCGRHNLTYNGGYKYDYNERHDPNSNITVYKARNCTGHGHMLPQADTKNCSAFTYESAYIKC
ncbi:hypothetical protein EJ110_NYTH52315 [Nymphaea thermarum]|nr:hypothetical protein EJ110_NYTH52315 [Nymphaea thermarum]